MIGLLAVALLFAMGLGLFALLLSAFPASADPVSTARAGAPARSESFRQTEPEETTTTEPDPTTTTTTTEPEPVTTTTTSPITDPEQRPLSVQECGQAGYALIGLLAGEPQSDADMELISRVTSSIAGGVPASECVMVFGFGQTSASVASSRAAAHQDALDTIAAVEAIEVGSTGSAEPQPPQPWAVTAMGLVLFTGAFIAILQIRGR